MRAAALLMLQAATIGPPTSVPDERLLHPGVAPACPVAPSEGIVVFGKAGTPDRYRAKALPAMGDTAALPPAEWRLFGDARMGAHGVERSVGGFSAPAAMVTVKIPF